MADTFIINEHIGKITHGPLRLSDDLPAWVEWQGEKFDTPALQDLEHMTYGFIQCYNLDGATIEPDGWT